MGEKLDSAPRVSKTKSGRKNRIVKTEEEPPKSDKPKESTWTGYSDSDVTQAARQGYILF